MPRTIKQQVSASTDIQVDFWERTDLRSISVFKNGAKEKYITMDEKEYAGIKLLVKSVAAMDNVPLTLIKDGKKRELVLTKNEYVALRKLIADN